MYVYDYASYDMILQRDLEVIWQPLCMLMLFFFSLYSSRHVSETFLGVGFFPTTNHAIAVPLALGMLQKKRCQLKSPWLQSHGDLLVDLVGHFRVSKMSTVHDSIDVCFFATYAAKLGLSLPDFRTCRVSNLGQLGANLEPTGSTIQFNKWQGAHQCRCFSVNDNDLARHAVSRVLDREP